MKGVFRLSPRPVRASSRRLMMARPAGAPTHPHPPHVPPVASFRRWVGPLVIAALVLLVGLYVLFGFGQSPAGAPRTPAATDVPSAAAPGGSPDSGVLTGGSALARRPSPSPSTSAAKTPIAPSTPTTTANPTPTRDPRAAPRTVDQFDVERQAIVIGFPLRPDTRYRYRDTFLDRREGPPDPYNHALRRDGLLVRAHDGADLYTTLGEPVLAPFDGVVLDPAERWQPWDPERYGLTAAVISIAPTSEGYVALLAHLDQLWVEPGQTVRQGEVIGTVGNTGNAEGVQPHLHFELRAPFRLIWQEAGQERPVDAFNPYPSLIAADPRRRR